MRMSSSRLLLHGSVVAIVPLDLTDGAVRCVSPRQSSGGGVSGLDLVALPFAGSHAGPSSALRRRAEGTCPA